MVGYLGRSGGINLAAMLERDGEHLAIMR